MNRSPVSVTTCGVGSGVMVGVVADDNDRVTIIEHVRTTTLLLFRTRLSLLPPTANGRQLRALLKNTRESIALRLLVEYTVIYWGEPCHAKQIPSKN